jgi:WD40 repeat protein
LIPDKAPQTLASVSFSSDKNNTFLAGGTSSGTVLLWNMNDLLRDPSTLPIILQGGVKVYDEVIFAPDNKWVFAYGSEEPLKAWRVNFEDVLNFACEVAGRNLSPTEWDLYGFTEEYRATCSNSAVQAQTVSTPAP